MADHLIPFLRAALANADDGASTFQWLSDEETVAIEHPGDSALTVRPWIEAQDLDVGVCERFGLRSLFLRGMLDVSGEDETGEPVLRPSEELQLVVDARHTGVGYIFAQSMSGNLRVARHNVIQREIGTFEEDIDGDGIHRFTACTYAAAMTRLARWAIPDAEHDGVQMRARIAPDRWPVWVVNEFGIDVRVTEMNLFLPGDGPDPEHERWVLAHAHNIAVLGTVDGESLEVTSMTTSRLRNLLGERLRQTL